MNNRAVFDDLPLVFPKGPGVEIVSVFYYKLRATRGRAICSPCELSGLAKTLRTFVNDLAQRPCRRLASRPHALFQKSAAELLGGKAIADRVSTLRAQESVA